ncbi:MAG: hypothetical protein ACAI43_14930 [Phycisphaerae bacterium]|nr:hypothetical protein [Tepidisphaeraceae bacterium]
MGIDFLDIVFRLEKEFSIKLPRAALFWTDAEMRLRRRERPPLTAGLLHRQLVEFLSRNRLDVPADSWERVRKCLSAALGVKEDEIRPDSRLIEDLGAT